MIPKDNKANATSKGKANTLYIGNIHPQTKEIDIFEILNPIAQLLGYSLINMTLNICKGYCFVDFDNRAVVDFIMDGDGDYDDDGDDGDDDDDDDAVGNGGDVDVVLHID